MTITAAQQYDAACRQPGTMRPADWTLLARSLVAAAQAAAADGLDDKALQLTDYAYDVLRRAARG